MKILRVGLPVVAASLWAGWQGRAEEPVRRVVAPAEHKAAPLERPAELKLAIQEIRTGKGAEAQKRIEHWMVDHKESPFVPEAWYLIGQGQAAQKQPAAAKKSLDQAKDLTKDRTLRALALLAIADCDFALGEYRAASRGYHWIEELYREVTAISHEEILFKLGLASKLAGFSETADYWFNRVIELYGSGRYAAEARRLNSKLGPAETGQETFYALEMASHADEQQALQAAEQYRTKGYREVRVVETRMFGATYYSVQVGKYFNRNDAKRALDDAELSGQHASITPGYVNWPR